MNTIPAKTIVTRAKSNAWFGSDYTMNIYRGCSHGCIYCDSRSECYGNDMFDHVLMKENALGIIQNELRTKSKKGVVATGAMSDPYNPFEEEYRLTRGALELLAAYGFGAAVATKGVLVTRDIDAFKGILRHAPVLVKITITTPHDELSRIIEPHAPPSSERLQALGQLAAAGIYCGVLLMPVLPFITDQAKDMRKLLTLVKEQGGRFVYPGFGVTLRDRQRAYYYDKLDAHFPGVKKQYMQRYGTSYACGSPHAKNLQNTFQELCQSFGLHYRMRDIIEAYQAPYAANQMSLFDC